MNRQEIGKKHIKEGTIIRNATLFDIEGITNITTETLLTKQSESSKPRKYGFLTIPLSADEIKSNILDTNNSIVMVAEKNNRIVGFTLGCNCKKLDALWKTELIIEDEALFILENTQVFFHDYIPKILQNASFSLLLFAPELLKKIRHRAGYDSLF